MPGFSFVDPVPPPGGRPDRRDSPRKVRAIGWTFLVLFAGVGVPFIVGGFRHARQQERRLRGAYPVPAVVIGTALRDPMPLKRGVRHRPSVRHRYTLPGGAVHESDLVFPLPAAKRGAREIIAPYHTGQVVTTWVPVDEPATAFLLRERAWDHWISIGVGLLFGAIGLGWWSVMLRLARHDERRARAAQAIVSPARAA